MGSWGVGPFDNDTAVVWLIRFQETPADRTHAMIRAAVPPSRPHAAAQPD